MEEEKWNSKISDDGDDFKKGIEFWNMSITDERCQKEDEDVKKILNKIQDRLPLYS